MAGARRLPLLLLAIVVALPVGNVRAAFSLRGSDTRRDERLIGWLGEVPRADATTTTTTTTTTTREAPRADDASASSLGPTRDIGVGDARVEKLSDFPRAYLFREFLTKEECAHLIEISTPHLKRSTVVGDDALLGEADGRRSDYRTSTGAFLPKLYDDVVTRVERRVEAFSRLPFENQEQLQLLRYELGQEYRDHVDGFATENGGKRVATVLMFLAEPEEGGETAFPNGEPSEAVAARVAAQRARGELSDCAWRGGGGGTAGGGRENLRGFAVKPRLGDAVLFFSYDADDDGGYDGAEVNHASTHASCPTTRGVKWTATKWIHERAFATGTWETPECVDRDDGCAGWARGGECAKNPGFMLGEATPGSCLKSCCDGGGGVEMPREMTIWQREFCASCEAGRTKKEMVVTHEEI